MDEERPNPQPWSSWSDWMADAVSLAQRGAKVTAQIQADWEDLSLQDSPWTTDRIMNEVVNSWERWTPFLGEMIQHGVEGVSQALREFWPDAAGDISTWRSSLNETPLGALASTYAGLTEEATNRMLRGEYQSADAVETVAKLGGLWAKDIWRRSAEARRAAEADDDQRDHDVRDDEVESTS